MNSQTISFTLIIRCFLNLTVNNCDKYIKDSMATASLKMLDESITFRGIMQ